MGGVAITRDRDLAIRLARVQQAFAEPSFSAQWRLSIQYQFYQWFFMPQLYWLAQGVLRGVRADGIGGLFVQRRRARRQQAL